MAKVVAFLVLIAVAGLVVYPRVVPGTSHETAPPADPNHDDVFIETISRGELVDIESYLVEGQRTLVEFTADW